MSAVSHSFHPNLLEQAASFVRRSRSLSSMLPSLVLSGLITLVITAVMHVMWLGTAEGFFGAWMESWLTAWPIAFPVTYVAGPMLFRLAARAPVAVVPMPVRREPGLAFNDILDASERVSARNGLTALRGLKPNPDFSAV
ncbi:MAG TPA: DUF2798 domain-containing protein [Noviherbaspirillum sp.]|uniref:DUF2798 domain-containing protein n=1 Tax=Noviherbaspirillum sp. TaxID=1926288 RepID=UPI002B483693|nr:DUF2798 domain-containing protein [Noviherbaspirillum sp.]HJV87725.1 DUF2798 domain-containing protein [Noviherbaspirillum sp.]